VDAVKDNVASSAEVAARLVQDKKFRKQLISAISHGAAARREVKSRTNVIPVALRLAGDRELRAEFQSAADDLRKAWGRVHRKRSHTTRNVMLGVLGVAGVAAAAREFLSGRDRPS
jgi:hypothetical protein